MYSTKYDSNVILYLHPTSNAQGLLALQKARESKGFPDPLKVATVEINGETLTYDRAQIKNAFSSLTSRSRLYIDGHGGAGSGYISDDLDRNVSVEKIAELISQYRDKTKILSIPGDLRRLRISMLCCEGGIGTETDTMIEGKRLINNSLAAQLLYYLTRNNPGTNYEIVGRLGSVISESILFDQLKRAKLVILLEHDDAFDKTVANVSAFKKHEPIPHPAYGLEFQEKYYHPKNDNTAKVIYTNYKGEQIIKTAYPKVSPWRNAVFETLAECLVQTRVPEKKAGLRMLINELIFLKDNEIDHKLGVALDLSQQMYPDQRKYHLYLHSGSGLFGFGSTHTVSEIQKLRAQYRRL